VQLYVLASRVFAQSSNQGPVSLIPLCLPDCTDLLVGLQAEDTDSRPVPVTPEGKPGPTHDTGPRKCSVNLRSWGSSFPRRPESSAISPRSLILHLVIPAQAGMTDNPNLSL